MKIFDQDIFLCRKFRTVLCISILIPVALCGLSCQSKRVKLFNKGTNLMGSQWDEAIEKFNEAIEIDPKFVDAYINRGITYGYKQNWKAAEADFTKAIELNPKSAVAFYNRGFARMRLHNRKGADADFDKCLELDKAFEREVNYQRGTLN